MAIAHRMLAEFVRVQRDKIGGEGEGRCIPGQSCGKFAKDEARVRREVWYWFTFQECSSHTVRPSAARTQASNHDGR
jgi:hypothetical protein